MRIPRSAKCACKRPGISVLGRGIRDCALPSQLVAITVRQILYRQLDTETRPTAHLKCTSRCDSVATRCAFKRAPVKKGRQVFSTIRSFAFASLLCAALAPAARAQESPYIVAYDHYMEEPGSLDVEYFSTFGTQRGGNDFHAFWMEFEYGATAWWTTEVYLDAQDTFHDGTVFTGFRWENRFRL